MYINAAFFYNGKVLALRGREEHRNLRLEQFRFKVTTDGKRYIEFWPIARKNLQGDAQHTKIRPECIKQFDSDASNSYYKIIKKYIEALGKNEGSFYWKPAATGLKFQNSLIVSYIYTSLHRLRKVKTRI